MHVCNHDDNDLASELGSGLASELGLSELFLACFGRTWLVRQAPVWSVVACIGLVCADLSFWLGLSWLGKVDRS